jgi:glyoxylase-like metal-dependent hydrolase (beta-lactamase superfamily II)
MARPIRITEEISLVGGGGLSSPGDAAIYLIDFPSHAAIVDAGCGGGIDKILNNIQECGVAPEQIEYLLITHCHYDHTGGARELKDATGCKIVAHELDARFLEEGNDTVTAARWYGSSIEPLQIDWKISGAKEIIEMGERTVDVIHIPGHSPGSVAFVTESDGNKVLFGQDVHGPLDSSLLSDKKEYTKSLDLLLSLDADILCEGHYGIFIGKENVKDFIRSYKT